MPLMPKSKPLRITLVCVAAVLLLLCCGGGVWKISSLFGSNDSSQTQYDNSTNDQAPPAPKPTAKATATKSTTTHHSSTGGHTTPAKTTAHKPAPKPQTTTVLREIDVDAWCGGVGQSEYVGGVWQCKAGSTRGEGPVNFQALCTNLYGQSAVAVNVDPNHPYGWGWRCRVTVPA